MDDRRASQRIMADRRGAVALWTGLTTPTLIAAMAVGIEVSDWATVQVSLQRTADAAALAGALNYAQSNNAQTAATAAANMAQINGTAGGNTPTWNAGSQTLTSGRITAQLTATTPNVMKVTAQRAVSSGFASIFTNSPSVTVSASSWAQITSTTTTSGPQPCIMALGTGITNDVTFGGSLEITSGTCSIRSNTGVNLQGSVEVNTAGIYAASTVTCGSKGASCPNGSIEITGPIKQNQGQIADPYATDTALQTALTNASSATGPAISYSGSQNVTLNPGSYTGISINGSTEITMNPGLYVVNGNVSFAGSTEITGHGVTIISTGYFDASGSSELNITAPTTASAVNGAIPGILFASKSTATMSFSGSAEIPFTGLIYYPNGQLDFYGSSEDGSSGCAEVIAGSIKFTGSVEVASSCSQYGTLTFGSVNQTSTTVSLIQ